MQYFSRLYDRLPAVLKNKYVLSSLVFAIWMSFFDSNNLMVQMERRSSIEDLEDQKEYYSQEIGESQRALDDLLSDPANMERFAREQYYMKRDNEEIFILVEE